MSGLFYNMGRKVGPKVRKAKWIWQSMTGTEADVIKVENDVGRDLAGEIRRQLRCEPQPQIEQMLSKIGPRLAACVANRFRTFSFEAVRGGEPNAFALPGGFIFVTGSLAELCRYNRDEIAFILAHEMGHVIRGHAMDRIISNTAISAASRITPARGLLSAWFQKVGVQFLESAYSQDLESEADKLAVRLAAAAGYDPQGSVRLLSRLAELKQNSEELDLGIYFSTHPAFSVRIRNVKRLICKLSS